VMSLDRKTAPIKIAWGSDKELIVELPNVGFSGDRYYGPAWKEQDHVEYAGSVMVIDPSGRGKDECAYAVVKSLHGMLFLQASGGYIQGYTQETLEGLATTAKDFGVQKILIEANFGDGMFTALLRPVLQGIYPCTTEEVKHSVQKEKRIIDTLEPILNQHRLVVSSDVIKKDYDSTSHLPQEEALRYQLFYQLTRITKEKGSLSHDDRLDALAMAVSYWVETMAFNVDQSVARHRAELLDKELERFMEHAIGRPRHAQTWMAPMRVALGKPPTDPPRQGGRRIS
jgi:hypothetical protein